MLHDMIQLSSRDGDSQTENRTVFDVQKQNADGHLMVDNVAKEHPYSIDGANRYCGEIHRGYTSWPPTPKMDSTYSSMCYSPCRYQSEIQLRSLNHLEDLEDDLPNMIEEEQAVLSEITLAVALVIIFSAITGLLMGYDLCLVAVVLEPIERNFDLCSAQIAQPEPLHAAENHKNTTRRILQTSFTCSESEATRTAASPSSDPSFRWRKLEPSPCSAMLLKNQYHSRRVLTITEDKGNYHSCTLKQLFVAMVSPGAAIGSLSAGFVSDWIGRRPTLALSDGLIMLGTFLMGLGHSFFVVLVGRFILGCGIGFGFVCFTTYVSEISPEKRRGQLVSCQEVAQCVGCLSAYATAALFGNDRWRLLFLTAGTVAGLQILGILILPESPRWHVRNKQLLKAENSLRRLAGLPVKKASEMSLKKKISFRWMIFQQSCKVTISNTFRRASDIENRLMRRQEEIQRKEAAVKHTMQRMVVEYEESKKRVLLKQLVVKKSEPLDIIFNTAVKYREWYRRESSQTTTTEKDYGGNSFSDQNTPTSCKRPSNFKKMSDESKNIDKDRNNHRSCSSLALHHEHCQSIEQDPFERSDTIERISSDTNQCCEQSSGGDEMQESCTYRLRQFVESLKHHHCQLLIAIGCAFCQNLTASTAILYYSTEIYRLAGVDNPFLAGVGIGVAKIIGILTVICFVEKIGRRRFLLAGSIGTFVCHLAFATSFSIQSLGVSSIVVTVGMTLFMFCQNISWAGLMFVVASEVLPSSLRGVGMGLTITVFWLCAFLCQSTFESLIETLTLGGVFLFYATLNLLAILFTLLYIPDLSGRTLEDITNHFEQRRLTTNQTESPHHNSMNHDEDDVGEDDHDDEKIDTTK